MTVLDAVQGAQVLLLAVALGAAGLAKLIIPAPPGAPAAAPPAVPPVAPPVAPPAGPVWLIMARSRQFAVAVGTYECALGIALLVTSHLAVRTATVVTFAAMTWMVGELRARRADAGCGCFGGLSARRAGLRSVARTALCTGASLAALTAPHPGVAALLDAPVLVGLALAAELAAFAALSPEIGELVERRRTPVPCERRRSPLSETYAALHASDAWLEHENSLVTAVPADHWRERCWRFVVYPARVDGQDVEIVFAVSTEERRRTVRAALVELERAGAPRVDARHDAFDPDDSGPNPEYALAEP